MIQLLWPTLPSLLRQARYRLADNRHASKSVSAALCAKPAQLGRWHANGELRLLGDQDDCIALLLLVPEHTLLLLSNLPANPLSGQQCRSFQHQLVALQRLACDYGIWQLQLLDLTGLPQVPQMLQQADNIHAESDQGWRCDLRRRMGRMRRFVLARCAELGIPADYASQRQLPLQREPRRLVALGEDCFQRPQQATAATARAWSAMRRQATANAIELQLVSAYRSHDYQYHLIQRKLQQGQSIAQILQVSAAPGFSEHHSGRALDLTSPGWQPLTSAFATTTAYAWLQAHAGKFGFVQSYPRDNVHGIAWEPWHWCWQQSVASD